MLAIGTGAQEVVLKQMELLGTNNVIIQPVLEQSEGAVSDDGGKQESKKFSPGLTLDDIRSIKEIVPGVEYISPEIVYETSFIRNARMRTGKLVGVNADYFKINNFKFAEGSVFSEQQIENADPVCVIGQDVKSRFFAGQNPIGEKIKAGNIWFTVIGVLEKREVTTENIENLGIRNYNLDVYAPATSVLLRFRNRALVTKSDLDRGGGSMVVMGGGIISSSTSGSGTEGSTNYHQ